MSEEEFDELLDLMSEQNLTRYGADKLYGEIVSREIERRTLKEKLQQKENIIKEVREYVEKHIAMFKNGDALVDMNINELLENQETEREYNIKGQEGNCKMKNFMRGLKSL